mmetsp:Transcript_38009/g.119329  ORF Transcript_38009/g.119329 Transcript_38009/m.119329 type:complete len:97 (-) Transcript_38009:201-491(-)
MVVKEKGGEVSASVAETNRIRALLGLKPLAGTEAAAQPADARPAVERLSPLVTRRVSPVGGGGARLVGRATAAQRRRGAVGAGRAATARQGEGEEG